MNDLNTMTDYELVSLYEQGNDSAFDIILKRHQDYVYSYITFVVRSEDRAEDIFQETFTRAIIAIRSHKYQTTGKFSAWLIRIAHNLIVDQMRNDEEIHTTSREDFPRDITDSLRYSEGSLETKLIEQQNIKTLRRLLSYLPESQREVVIMHFYENLTFREIAEKTNVSINTSLGRMRYALINLRKLIQKHQISLVG
ncbi:MAG: sigma-70 family RNA polymerase sigma factor [Bacteroidaceae bacterium]|nr:sigma-70 family RNA polymerase sigma factor [Bacteroidaceae bacterium]